MLKRCLVIALVAWAAIPLFAQRRGGQPQTQAPSEPSAATTAAQQQNESAAGRQNTEREVATAAEEKISQTSHTVRLDGRELWQPLELCRSDSTMARSRRGCFSSRTPRTART